MDSIKYFPNLFARERVVKEWEMKVVNYKEIGGKKDKLKIKIID